MVHGLRMHQLNVHTSQTLRVGPDTSIMEGNEAVQTKRTQRFEK